MAQVAALKNLILEKYLLFPISFHLEKSELRSIFGTIESADLEETVYRTVRDCIPLPYILLHEANGFRVAIVQTPGARSER